MSENNDKLRIFAGEFMRLARESGIVAEGREFTFMDRDHGEALCAGVSVQGGKIRHAVEVPGGADDPIAAASKAHGVLHAWLNR